MSDTLKRKLAGRSVMLGSWITLYHTAIAEIMAKAGFEWLTVDMEHSSITLDQAQHLIQVIGLSETTPLVRVGENNPVVIKRVMDAGAHGIIVPMVNSADDARNAVNSVKYPPIGKRGVGLARAQGYGFEFETYKKWVNKDSVVIVQIEHIEAVDNLDHILNVDGVDAFIVGPYDLSASMGLPGKFKHPKVLNALKKIMEISRHHAVAPGFHVIPPDSREVLRKIKAGYRFIGVSLDTLFLGLNCRDVLKGIEKDRLV